ncbi:lantibiotic dehydratase [Actinomadura sp. 3N407]|uniref:lantibiotic dehydratase n=1 Tax=Actinomadura sp. 3N407 TaxID=3457423 RepID=UPI003FCD89DF
MTQSSGPATSPQDDGTGLYEAPDLFMLRAPILPADIFANLDEGEGTLATALPDAPNATGAALAHARAEGRQTLRRLAASPRTRQAIQVASSSLGAALDRLDDNAPHDKATGRRYAALLRYLVRMSSRPTPLGLFAGVAAGTFRSEPMGDDLATSLNAGGSGIAMLCSDPVLATRTRADSAWLARVVERIERDPLVRDKLRVRVNTLLHRIGGLAVLLKLDFQEDANRERIELAINRPLAVALELAERNPTFGELAVELADRFPTTAPEKIRSLLDRLWEEGIILGDLLPSPVEPLPEVHLIKRLTDQNVPTGAINDLMRMRRLADDVDRGAGRADAESVSLLEAHQRAMTPDFTGPTLQLDTALALKPSTLPVEIGKAAAAAAELLMRLGCTRQRRPYIADYHRIFLEHYGADSEVPLLDVLNSETGLGPPNLYFKPARRQPLPQQPEPVHPERDRALVELAVRAARDGLLRIDLDDELADRLTVWRPDEAHSRPRTAQDLIFQIAGASPEAIRDGRWLLVLSTIGSYGGWQAFGRFSDLIDEAALARIRGQQRLEETLRPDTVFAELNYEVRHSRRGNLAGHPPTRGYEICVNTSPTGPPVKQIPLTDIVVGANAEHFYLRSLSRGRYLSVSQTHALSATTAPNICRALLDFSEDGYSPRSLFEWGAAAGAPFLPRLTRGKVVLHPAQWMIDASTFPDCRDPDAFFYACQRWRREWQVPRFTHLTVLDNRLLLDLDHPMWVDELHRNVTRLRDRLAGGPGEQIQLMEALPGPDDLWLRDRDDRPYHAEIAVPLVLRDRTRMPQPAPTRAGAPPAAHRRWLPGDEWLHLKLYAAADRHDRIIAGPLRALLADEQFARLVDRWFFIRYSDPLPHLRLRFHTPTPDSAAEVMSLCSDWARGLVRTRLATDLAFCSYAREVERYGGGHAIERMESAFWANSQAAVELVHLLHTERGRFDPDVVRVTALHELYRAWGADPPLPDGHSSAWLTDEARHRFRELRPLLCEILVPGERRPDQRAQEYRDALNPVFARQWNLLAEAGSHIRELASRRLLTGSEENVIKSLAHIQSIRLVGLDHARERMDQALWQLGRRAIRNRPARTSR